MKGRKNRFLTILTSDGSHFDFLRYDMRQQRMFGTPALGISLHSFQGIFCFRIHPYRLLFFLNNRYFGQKCQKVQKYLKVLLNYMHVKNNNKYLWLEWWFVLNHTHLLHQQRLPTKHLQFPDYLSNNDMWASRNLAAGLLFRKRVLKLSSYQVPGWGCYDSYHVLLPNWEELPVSTIMNRAIPYTNYEGQHCIKCGCSPSLWVFTLPSCARSPQTSTPWSTLCLDQLI